MVKDHSKTGPFDFRTQIHHSKTGLVQFSDGYCIRNKHNLDKMFMLNDKNLYSSTYLYLDWLVTDSSGDVVQPRAKTLNILENKTIVKLKIICFDAKLLQEQFTTRISLKLIMSSMDFTRLAW
jgi:hypothetical protein